MKKIRIGKDIEVRWNILTNGQAEALTGRNLSLEIANRWGRKGCRFTTDSNTVVFTFRGREQTKIGEYSLTLWENKGLNGQTCVDACQAFELVECTCAEGGMDEGLDTETVSLESGDLIGGVPGADGKSAYQSWLDSGHEGTEADFMDWLRQPAAGAVDSANEALEKANETLGQAETAIKTANEAKDTALAAANSVTDAISAANEAAKNATAKATEAETAASAANEAKASIDEAKTAADNAAKSANEAASAANAAATNAPKNITIDSEKGDLIITR